MPPLAFQENERVLCFHGPLIYEAKVLQAEDWKGDDNEDGDTGPHFFVHYKGWKATWDEWVPDTRILKLNDENKAKQKQLVESREVKSKASAAASSSKEGGGPSSSHKRKAGNNNNSSSHNNNNAETSTSSGRPSKRGRDSGATPTPAPTVDTEEEWAKKPEIKIDVPDVLKVQLVDDWEAVTKNNQLVPLPRSPNVDALLHDYQEQYRASNNKVSNDLMREVCSGLRLYFTKCLGNNLLYRFERGQYAEQQDKDVAQVYGAEHLLRLFVNLPELLAHTTMGGEALTVLKDALHDILQWLAKNQKHYLLAPLDAYENTSGAYQNLARA